jgi:hypothetical protein
MKKIIFFISVFSSFMMLSVYSHAQPTTDHWAKWKNMMGDWVGEGAGQPGKGAGSFSFKPDLDGKILVRKNHAGYPAAQDKPAFQHNDLMIVYPGENGNPDKAIYFDNEGHVINYMVAFSEGDKKIVFTSDVIDKVPRFRLSYTFSNDDLVKIKFEFAPPGQPEAFSPYIEATASRKK